MIWKHTYTTRLRSILNNKRRRRRLILFGISAVSLLWAGCQRAIGYSEADSYCYDLRYSLLSNYQLKHHQWPTTLDDVERDVEANAYVGPRYLVSQDKSVIVKIFRRYKPVMTVRWKTPTEIGIDVRFTRRQSLERRVDTNSVLNSDLEGSATGVKNE